MKSSAFSRTKFARTRSQLCLFFFLFFPPKERSHQSHRQAFMLFKYLFQSCHVRKWIYLSPQKKKKKRWANTHSYSPACLVVSVWNSMMSVTVRKRCSRCPCCCVELDQMSLLVCHMFCFFFTKNCWFYQKQSFWMLFSRSRAFFLCSKG